MVYLITGPTASGKSEIAMQIARKNNGVIINIDSIQGYRDIPILSASPSVEDMQEVPHLLYGFLASDEMLSFGEWLKKLAKYALEVIASGRTPIVCGGTMMYVYRLIKGFSEIPSVSSEIENHIEELYASIGHDAFLQKVMLVDPNTYQDVQRLKRNMCLIEEFGKTAADFAKAPQMKLLDDVEFEIIIPNKTRKQIYENCDKRFSKMMELGAIDEVKCVMDYVPISRAAGFIEIKRYIMGEISLDDAITLGRQKTRNYAKSQETWIGKMVKEGIDIKRFDI